jgi:hypothetical protein
MRKQMCRNCKHYTQTGLEDSGLKTGWTYAVGDCAKIGQKLVAEWRNCYEWEKKKCKQN